mgnify:CR=1 FL=1
MFGINTTSDLSKLLTIFRILWASYRAKVEQVGRLQVRLQHPTDFAKNELKSVSFTVLSPFSFGNSFSLLFTGHMFFQIFLLIGHFTNWTGHNLFTDIILKKITQNVPVRCSLIASYHNVNFAGHFQSLVGQYLVTDCNFQHCLFCQHNRWKSSSNW